jgi:PilZ domain
LASFSLVQVSDNRVTPMSEEQAVVAPANHRLVRRRTLKKGVALTLRQGAMGLGPNLAVGGVEVSDDGIQLRVKAELKKGDEVEIGLTGIGRSKPMNMMADVRWCRAEEEGDTFLVGIKFRRRLGYADLALFV